MPWVDISKKISLPSEQTGQILSKFKTLYRSLQDILDSGLSLEIFSRVFKSLHDAYIDPLINLIEDNMDSLHEKEQLSDEEAIYKRSVFSFWQKSISSSFFGQKSNLSRLADELGYFINSIENMQVFTTFKDFTEMVERLKEILSLAEIPEEST